MSLSRLKYEFWIYDSKGKRINNCDDNDVNKVYIGNCLAPELMLKKDPTLLNLA